MADRRFIAKDRNGKKVNFKEKYDAIVNTIDYNDEQKVNTAITDLEDLQVDVDLNNSKAIKSDKTATSVLIGGSIFSLVVAFGLSFALIRINDMMPILKVLTCFIAGSALLSGVVANKIIKSIKNKKLRKNCQELKDKANNELSVLKSKKLAKTKTDVVVAEQAVVEKVKKKKYYFRVKSTTNNSDKKGSITKFEIDIQAETEQDFVSKLENPRLMERIKTLSERLDDSNRDKTKCTMSIIVTDITKPTETITVGPYKKSGVFLTDATKFVEAFVGEKTDDNIVEAELVEN